MRADEQPATEAWSCKRCNDQMFGGPRCYEHNPTPEQREQREREQAAAPRKRPPPSKQSRKRKRV